MTLNPGPSGPSCHRGPIAPSGPSGTSARSGDLRLDTMHPSSDPDGLQEVEGLLHSVGLRLDPDVELFVTARAHAGSFDHADHGERGRLVGCMGLAGSVVKCSAIEPAAQGAGVAGRLMERINYEALDRGRSPLFVFTTPCNREVFERLGFMTLAQVPGLAVLLENTPFGLADYRRRLRALRRPGRRIGAVVLNANPFTLGHRHLVATAAADVDVLHVFVVAEDASLFGADVRLRLVRAGVAELSADLGLGDRITVHPGSPYIVSRATFPAYFLHDQDARADAAAGLDLQLFRDAIAPELGITDRYVGTEPLSAVTASYNAQMRRRLQDEPGAAPGSSRRSGYTRSPAASSTGIRSPPRGCGPPSPPATCRRSPGSCRRPHSPRSSGASSPPHRTGRHRTRRHRTRRHRSPAHRSPAHRTPGATTPPATTGAAMRITREALAGTLESSGVLVRVHPSDDLRIDVRSSVMAQYGDDIRRVVTDELTRLGVTDALVAVDDKGALEFVIRARVEGAIRRGATATPAHPTSPQVWS